jgi:hypothetical protein
VWALLGRRCECARAVMCDGAEVVHGRGWRAVEGGGGAEGARWKAAAAARECDGRGNAAAHGWRAAAAHGRRAAADGDGVT